MKILNTTEFAKLPEGVLFSEYERKKLSRLKVKGKTVNFDSSTSWSEWYEALLNKIVEYKDCVPLAIKENDSSSLDIDYFSCENPPDKLFAVWEIDDLIKLFNIIEIAISVTEFKL